MVSDEESVIEYLLYVTSAFKIVSFSLVFESLILMRLSLDIFQFILFGVELLAYVD